MALFSRNVQFAAPLHLTGWRKTAIGTWHSGGDPSVYGSVDVDMGPMLAYIETLRSKSDLKITLSHLIGKVMAETLSRHPSINCVLRFGKLYPRKTIDLFFQVASDHHGNDLSGAVIRMADQKSVHQIAQELYDRVASIKHKGDRDFKKMKNTMKALPGLLAYPVIQLSGFLMYGLNLWTPLLGIPKDPFGSVMITNIGSLGLDSAFAPLVPYSRVPLLVAIGAVKDKPIVKDGKVIIAPVAKICVTFDHRIIDGVHAGHLSKAFLQICANPESELTREPTASASSAPRG